MAEYARWLGRLGGLEDWMVWLLDRQTMLCGWWLTPSNKCSIIQLLNSIAAHIPSIVKIYILQVCYN